MLRRHWGRIVYHSAAGEQGREDFAIDVRAGGRTVRAYCEMEDGSLTRDASWTLDPLHRPVEGHVRVVRGGALLGSSWYRFTDTCAECESLTADGGRASQRLAGGAAYLGLHPLIGDGLIALARGTDAPGEERMIDGVTCSYGVDGDTTLTALPVAIGVTYVEPCELAVPAGRFATHLYLLRWQPHWPPARLWVTGDDAILVRLTWEVSGLDCQLASFATSAAPRSPQFGEPAGGSTQAIPVAEQRGTS